MRASALHQDAHLASRRGELDGVVEEVRQDLAAEVPVPLDDGRAADGAQAEAALLRQGLEQLDRLGGQGREVEGAEGGAAAGILHLADPQDGGDHAERLIDPREPLIDGEAQLLQGARLVAAALQAGAQPREGRAQVVGHRVADAADLGHEVLDAVEHPVHVAGEAGELVVARAHRQPVAQVPLHNPIEGGLRGGEAPSPPVREEEAAGHGQHEGRGEGEAEGPQGHVPHPVELVGIVADERGVAVRQGEGGGPDHVVEAAPREGDSGRDPHGIAIAGQPGGKRGDVAEPGGAIRREHPAVMGGVGIHGDPRLDPRRRQGRVGGGGADLEAERLGQFVPQQACRLPVDEGEERGGEQHRPQGDAERPAEGRGAQEVSHRGSG